VIDSRFRVQAGPGATGFVYELTFTFSGIGFPLPHFALPGLGQGFKGYEKLIFVILYAIFWIGPFHPWEKNGIEPD
jgi:hypothetical protein